MEEFFYPLIGIAAGLLIVLLARVRMRLIKNEEERLKRMEEKSEKMEAYLDGIPSLPPDNPIRKGFDDGIRAMDEYKWNEAIGIFRNLLPNTEGEQKGTLLNFIGLCFYQQDKLDKALGHYQESLKLAEEIQDKEGRVVNLNNIGMVYAQKGDYDAAIRDYTKAIEIDPNNADTFSNRGAAYYTEKDYDTAIRDFDKAIELDSELARAFYNRGNAYADKKDYDTAIRDFNKVIELNPNYAIAMANMGDAYKLKVDKDKAREWYRKALEKKEYLPDGGEEIVRQRLKELGE